MNEAVFFFFPTLGCQGYQLQYILKGSWILIDVICREQLQLKGFQCIGTMLRYDIKEELLCQTPCKHSNNGQKRILLSRKLCGAEDYWKAAEITVTLHIGKTVTWPQKAILIPNADLWSQTNKSIIMIWREYVQLFIEDRRYL